MSAEAPLPKSLKAVLGGEAKDALVFGTANFLRKFGGFFLVPLYMRRLSPEDYGVLAVVTMVGSIQGLLGSGSLELSITRFFYEWTDEDRPRNLGAIWVWNWITTLACTALFLLVLPFATPFLFPELEFYPYLWLGVIANALGDLFVVPASVIRIKRLPWLFALYSFTSFGLSTGLGVWFVVVRNEKLMGYLQAMTWSNALMALFGAAVMFAYARPCLNSPGLREAVRLALPVIPSNLIGTVGALLDRFLLNYFASLETLGLYSVAMKFVDVISGGVHPSLKMTFGPFMMKELAGDKDAGKATVAAITPFYMLPYFAAGLGLVYFVGPFLHVIDRPAYFPVIEAIPWLVGVAILGSLNFYYTNGMFLANRTGALWMPAALQLLVLVVACALLIPRFEFAGLIASRYLSVTAFLAFSLYLSQKFYPIAHHWKTLVALAGAATVFALANPWLKPSNPFLEAGLKVPFLAAFAGGAYWLLSRERQVVR